MPAWLTILAYELLSVKLAEEDMIAGRRTPWWREPLTRPVWALQQVHPLLRASVWAFLGWVLWHFTVEPFLQESLNV